MKALQRAKRQTEDPDDPNYGKRLQVSRRLLIPGRSSMPVYLFHIKAKRWGNQKFSHLLRHWAGSWAVHT